MKSIFILFITFIIAISISAQTNKVFLITIDEEIDIGLVPYVTRVIHEAEISNASAVIVKINTFGGRVDAATQIKDALLKSKIRTIAFINNRAISAGSLIALSCNKIIMAPGGSIGAATVVDQMGEKQSEKYQSYMRSEMRSTAEKNGRRTDIAQGMVDERIIIPGLVDSTQLVTLTTEEAIKYGIADIESSDLIEGLKKLGFENVEVVNNESNWAENVVKFLNNSLVSSILIMIGIFGLIAEVKTPGWGVPGTAGVIALALFFGSSYILQLASTLDIILFIIGLILLAAEIFVIPGFGVAGIGGILLILISLFLSLTPSGPFFNFESISLAFVQLAGALAAAFILILALAKFLPKSRSFSKLILDESEKSEKGFVSYPSEKNLIGAEGVALTTLRPAGTAEINGKRVDVMTDSEYVQQGSRIVVERVEGIKVVVKKIS
ncbi:MAG: nodulation protein NfeD [Ignavibacteriales bacterium]|nr:nodulation protein NfeD [Ignavibacteriales bacterium]